MKEKIIHNIKTIRESKNLSEQYIGTSMGIGQSSYCKKEKGDREFTLTELIKLSEIMEVSLVRLIELDIAKIINQQNHDNSTGIIEHQTINNEGYKLCIEQYKTENAFLREQLKK